MAAHMMVSLSTPSTATEGHALVAPSTCARAGPTLHGEADRSSGAKRIGGLGGHDTEVKVLGEGAIAAGGELVGLGQAGGGG